MLDNSPLVKTVEKIMKQFNGTFHRKMLIGATDVDNGHEYVYDFDTLTEQEDKVMAIIGSASVPVVFPFATLQGAHLMDSLSTGWNNNMVSAI